MQLLASRLYFVNDRSQLLEYDLNDLKENVTTKKFYKGKVKSLSVVDFAVNSIGNILAVSENGTIEMVNSEKSRTALSESKLVGDQGAEFFKFSCSTSSRDGFVVAGFDAIHQELAFYLVKSTLAVSSSVLLEKQSNGD